MNPFISEKETTCDHCNLSVEKGEFLYDDHKQFVCEDCAEEREIICPQCSVYKKSDQEFCKKCINE